MSILKVKYVQINQLSGSYSEQVACHQCNRLLLLTVVAFS